MVRGWLMPPPGGFNPGKETRYPLYRRVGGKQIRSERQRKMSSTSGFDPRTLQFIASGYTNYTILARACALTHTHTHTLKHTKLFQKNSYIEHIIYLFIFIYLSRKHFSQIVRGSTWTSTEVMWLSTGGMSVLAVQRMHYIKHCKVRDFSLLQSIQTGPRDLKSSYSMDNSGPFPSGVN
jgi:hypothetical protein